MSMWQERKQMGGWHRYEGDIELLADSYFGAGKKFYFKIIASDWVLRSTNDLKSIEEARRAADEILACIVLD